MINVGRGKCTPDMRWDAGGVCVGVELWDWDGSWIPSPAACGSWDPLIAHCSRAAAEVCGGEGTGEPLRRLLTSDEASERGSGEVTVTKEIMGPLPWVLRFGWRPGVSRVDAGVPVLAGVWCLLT